VKARRSAPPEEAEGVRDQKRKEESNERSPAIGNSRRECECWDPLTRIGDFFRSPMRSGGGGARWSVKGAAWE